MKRILIIAVFVLLRVVVNGQVVTVNNLIDTLTKRGYVLDQNIKDQKVLERYLLLDNRLIHKDDSLVNVFKSLDVYAKYINVAYADPQHPTDFEYLSNSDPNREELRNKVSEFMGRSNDIKEQFKTKPRYANKFLMNGEILSYDSFLNKYETAINSFDKPTDTKDFEFIIETLKSFKIKFQWDSVRKIKLKKEIASLPTKAAVKAKFITYTHRTGNVFEMFPIGFTPKANKPVIDRVFGRKAMYREVDGNGMNTLKIEYYDSGNVLNVTVYKGGSMIYSAEYRDHAKKAYQILSKSADGKFELLHKRTYDMYDNKTYISTKYWYKPLDYEYE